MPQITKRPLSEVGTNTLPIVEFSYRYPLGTKKEIREMLERDLEENRHSYDPDSVTFERLRRPDGTFKTGWQGTLKVVRYGQHYGRRLETVFLPGQEEHTVRLLDFNADRVSFFINGMNDLSNTIRNFSITLDRTI